MNRELSYDDVVRAYRKAGITPMYVVLGGSRSYGYADEMSDYDYFGYHLEETEKSHIRIVVDQGNAINSYKISLANDIIILEDPVLAQHLISDLLWCVPVFMDRRMQVYINRVRSEFEQNREAYVSLFSDAASLLIDGTMTNDGLFDKDHHHWLSWLRILLTSWYLEDTGHLNCSLDLLLSFYQIDIESLNSPQDVFQLRNGS